MNRLSPWIVRRPGAGRVLAIAVAVAGPSPLSFAAGAQPPLWLEDVRLFLTGWIGGLVFFGTLLG